MLKRISFFTMLFFIVFALSMEKEIANKEKEKVEPPRHSLPKSRARFTTRQSLMPYHLTLK